MRAEINNWQSECEKFQNWFQALGGNISSNEQMTEAFSKIEAKKLSDNRLYELLEADRAKQIEVNEPEIL